MTFGDASVMPTERVGKYVHPRDWNALISDPNTVSNLILQYVFALDVYFF